jgi:UDP-N-acetylmuramyl pentapeptide phosphotransferase/UDP-N-acetylglucosamine-1-phosphate transferase
MMYYLAAPMVSFFVVFGMLCWLLKGAMAGAVLDHPNQRSLHTLPRPRTGGLAMITGVLAAWLAAQSSWGWVMMSMVFFLSAVSFLDDVRGLSVIWRFLAHFVAAGMFVADYILPGLGFLGAALAVLAMVWMTNLYNFMDGSDGLAGGMALFGFGFYGVAAWTQGDMAFAGLCWSVSAASVAFLLFNFHPARIFMGDAGSIPLGFLAAALGLLGWSVGHWPLWFPMLVFSPFILDASVTLVKRLLRREKVWQAHCEHYYQRLVKMGWGHRRTALAEYALMAPAGASATWAIGQDDRMQLIVCMGWSLAYLLGMWLVDSKWSRSQEGG